MGQDVRLPGSMPTEEMREVDTIHMDHTTTDNSNGSPRDGDVASPQAVSPLTRTQKRRHCNPIFYEEDEVKVDRLIKLFQREVNKGFIFRELIPYCSFLLFMLVIMMVSRAEQYDAGVHRTVNAVADSLIDNNFGVSNDLTFKKTFWDVSGEDDFWRWLESPYLSSIWGGDPVDGSMIAQSNKPLGFIVIRQQRVTPRLCSEDEGYHAVALYLKQFLPKLCYPDYHSGYTSTLSGAPYGDFLKGEVFATAQSLASEIEFPSMTGLYSTYKESSKTFYSKIRTDNNTLGEAVAKIRAMRASNWVDEATRFIAVDVLTLNRNTGTFLFTSAFLEISAGGEWHPNVRMVPFRFLSIASVKGVAIFILDVIVTIYFFYIFYRLVQTLFRNWKLHGEILSFFGFWNTYALANMLLFMLTYGYRWHFWHITVSLKNNQFNGLTERELERMWSEMVSWAFLYESSWNCYGFACALAIGGFFRFTQYNPRLFLLVETVERALGELLSVVAMMSIVVFAYGLLGNILFGYYMTEYKSFVSSCGTLLRHLIGDFAEESYYRMRDSQNNAYTAVVFIMSYTFIAWCILLNMVLAIINESLAAVKTKAGQQDIMIMKWLQKHSNRLYSKCAKMTRGHSTHEDEEDKGVLERRLKREKELLRQIYEKMKIYKYDKKYAERMRKNHLKDKVWRREGEEEEEEERGGEGGCIPSCFHLFCFFKKIIIPNKFLADLNTISLHLTKFSQKTTHIGVAERGCYCCAIFVLLSVILGSSATTHIIIGVHETRHITPHILPISTPLL